MGWAQRCEGGRGWSRNDITGCGGSTGTSLQWEGPGKGLPERLAQPCHFWHAAHLVLLEFHGLPASTPWAGPRGASVVAGGRETTQLVAEVPPERVCSGRGQGRVYLKALHSRSTKLRGSWLVLLEFHGLPASTPWAGPRGASVVAGGGETTQLVAEVPPERVCSGRGQGRVYLKALHSRSTKLRGS
jgi:hypothetical protein